MTAPMLSLDALSAELRGPPLGAATITGGEPPLVVVDLDDATGPVVEPGSGYCRVIVGCTELAAPLEHPAAGACDLVLQHGDPALDVVADTVADQPIAAVALALVLRGSERRGLDDGLQLESAAYSALQAGAEFAAWRASRPLRASRAEGDPVVLERSDGRLDIVLSRPHVRNALNAAMRDALVAAFRLVALDPSITEVHLRGTGLSYSAGGDLDEFGSFPDPAVAHLLRLQQSVGRALAAVADRVTVHLHGNCVGSGIEVPAFAGTVLAQPSTTIALPEVSLGLIPGAGGTVSLPKRIGRHRTAWLALTGLPIDATTAAAWGLVDGIDPGTS